MTAPLPPLSATSCAKCGAPPTAIGLRFYDKNDMGPYGTVARLGWEHGELDRMERRCTLCNFAWLEAPRDTTS